MEVGGPRWTSGGPDGPRGTPMDLGGPRWRSGGTPDGGREHPDGGRAATPMELGPPRRPSRQTSTASGRHLDLHRGAPTTPSRFSGRVCISTRRDSWPLGAPPGGPSERSYGLVYLIPTPPSRRTARGAAGKGRNQHFGRVRRGGFLTQVKLVFFQSMRGRRTPCASPRVCCRHGVALTRDRPQMVGPFSMGVWLNVLLATDSIRVTHAGLPPLQK